MTGMTDISRHGGDKRFRDELDIRIKDDALVDPQMLGIVPTRQTATDQLVDDSDDDDGYEIGDSDPGMAAKVVHVGAKLLVFPLILAYRAVILLKYLPWLGGQILRGIKNIPMLPKLTGQFFRGLLSGRLGKTLLVIGTVTGTIWVSRKVTAMGTSFSEKRKAKRLAAEEAALEAEILAEEAAKSNATRRERDNTTTNREPARADATITAQPAQVQSGNGPRKATATVQFIQPQPQHKPNTVATPSQRNQIPTETASEPEEQKPRRKLGFGQLSKLASAFKRSEPVTSREAASPNTALLNDDRYDPFEAANHRWGAKKSMMFAAACLVLLIGGVTVAKQVMQSNSDEIAALPPDDGPLNDDPNAGMSDTGTQEPQPNVSGFGSFPVNPSANINTLNANNDSLFPPPYPVNISAASDMGGGMPDYGSNNRSVPSNLAFVEPEQFSSLAVHDVPSYETQPLATADSGFSDRGSGIQVSVVDDPEEPVAANGWFAGNDDGWVAPTQPMMQSDAGMAGYGHGYASGSDAFASMPAYHDPAEFPASSLSMSDSSLSPSPLSGTSLSGTSGNFNLTTSNVPFDHELPTVPAQTVLQENSAALFTLGGTSQSVPNAASVSPPEETNPFPFAATPRLSPDRGMTLQSEPSEPYVVPQSAAQSGTFHLSSNNREPADENAAPLAEVWRNPPQPSVTNDHGNGMELAALGVATPGSAGMTDDQYERVAWNTVQNDHVLLVDQTPLQPYTPPQQDTGFSLSQNDSPTQTPFQQGFLETVAAPIEPMVSSTPIPANDSMLSGNFTASNGVFGLSPQFEASEQIPSVPTQSPAAIARPLAVSTAAPAFPLSPPVATQESLGGIVSPSEHIAVTLMGSPESQASTATQFTPPTVMNAEPAPAYAERTLPSLNAVQGSSHSAVQDSSQQFVLPMTGAQPVSYGQNAVYIVQPDDNIYKIAKQELGSVRRYREIYDLNRDRLPIGQDTLTAGTELLLPTM